METQTNMISPKAADAESTMRRNLGLDGTSPSLAANDPLRMARQAIRSQVTAREYTERQLGQAQNTIQDLRAKLRHVDQERESAINAAQSAMAARDAAERSMKAAEAALATERATRLRTEGMLRDGEATIRDLREKLATANQSLHGVQAELDAERLSRVWADDGVIVVPEMAAPIVREDVPAVRRPVGRPRKVAVVEMAQTLITPSKTPPVSRGDEVATDAEVAVPTIRRPVGRPRKMEPVEASKTPIPQSKNPRASAKAVTTRAVKPKPQNQRQGADDQEPVQWWVEGWKGR
jgi:hypothetical protein